MDDRRVVLADVTVVAQRCVDEGSVSLMSRRTELQPGDVVSFRIPEYIQPADLNYLRQLSNRETGRKRGALGEFFFSKVAEARVEDGPHVSVQLEGLNSAEQQQLDNPIFHRVMALYAYQLLGRTPEQQSVPLNLSGPEQIQRSTINKKESSPDIPDPRTLDLMYKLRGS